MAKRDGSNVTKGNGVGVPPNYKGTVIARFIKQEFAPSKSSGNPMITLTAEIVNPEQITSDMDGKAYDLAGQELKFYLVLAEETAAGKPWDSLDYIVNQLLPLLNLGSSIDDEAPLKSAENPSGLDFEGVTFEVIVATEQRKETRTLPNGQRVAITDASGKEITRGWQWKVDMKSILRLATVEANRAF